MNDLFFLVIGLSALLLGGELLVRGATKIAQSFGMSPLLIGLTVVSLGTSAPEMAICMDAAFMGSPEIALGNIVGSNISNVLLILGLTAVVYPIVVHRKILQREVPLMIGASALFLLLAFDGNLHPTDGLILLSAMALFLIWQFLSSKGSKPVETSGPDSEQPEVESLTSKSDQLLSIVWVVVGVASLWFGARWMVGGAAEIAESFGVSQLVIGLTIVAVGSSAPEIITSLLAARRGYPELAVGAVIGSNIANLLLVGGATAAVSRNIVVPVEAFQFDIPVMMVASVACLPIFASGNLIDRWEGSLFLICYVAFNAILFLKSIYSDQLPTWFQLVWPIALPLVLGTLLALWIHRLKFRSSKD